MAASSGDENGTQIRSCSFVLIIVRCIFPYVKLELVQSTLQKRSGRKGPIEGNKNKPGDEEIETNGEYLASTVSRVEIMAETILLPH